MRPGGDGRDPPPLGHRPAADTEVAETLAVVALRCADEHDGWRTVADQWLQPGAPDNEGVSTYGLRTRWATSSTRTSVAEPPDRAQFHLWTGHDSADEVGAKGAATVLELALYGLVEREVRSALHLGPRAATDDDKVTDNRAAQLTHVLPCEVEHLARLFRRHTGVINNSVELININEHTVGMLRASPGRRNQPRVSISR